MVKPGNGVDILVKFAGKDTVNLMERNAIVFCGGANFVDNSNTQMVLQYHRRDTTIILRSVPHIT